VVEPSSAGYHTLTLLNSISASQYVLLMSARMAFYSIEIWFETESELLREVGPSGHLEHRVLVARLALVLHHMPKPHHVLPEDE
jgi:hypothetical protein